MCCEKNSLSSSGLLPLLPSHWHIAHVAGYQVVIVSSGAVGLGVAKLGLQEKPATISGKQAAAAIGQVLLMSLYQQIFQTLGLACAQVLLTYDSFGERNQYTNAKATLQELLRCSVVPIINENDSVAVSELRVGDNDTLSAMVAAMVGAQWLFLLTDVDSLFSGNPRTLPEARPIRVVPTQCIQSLRLQMQAGVEPLSITSTLAATGAAGGAARGAAGTGSAGSALGTGGMLTKLKAAQIATAAGVTVVITNTEKVELLIPALAEAAAAVEGDGGTAATAAVIADVTVSPALSASAAADAASDSSPAAPSSSSSSFLSSLEPEAAAAVASLPGGPASSKLLAFARRAIGTTLLPVSKPASGRKRWILGLASAGQLELDAGAANAVTEQRKSLFPAGVVSVRGHWEPQDAVQLVVQEPSTVPGQSILREVARCLVNYSSDDCSRVLGKRSKEMMEVLGWSGPETLADRDNIVILEQQGARHGHGAGAGGGGGASSGRRGSGGSGSSSDAGAAAVAAVAASASAAASQGSAGEGSATTVSAAAAPSEGK